MFRERHQCDESGAVCRDILRRDDRRLKEPRTHGHRDATKASRAPEASCHGHTSAQCQLLHQSEPLTFSPPSPTPHMPYTPRPALAHLTPSLLIPLSMSPSTRLYSTSASLNPTIPHPSITYKNTRRTRISSLASFSPPMEICAVKVEGVDMRGNDTTDEEEAGD